MRRFVFLPVALGVYLVSEVSRIFAQAHIAGGMLLRRAKAESDRMLDFSAERLGLVVENERLKKEVATLQSLEDLHGKQNEELEEKVEHLDVALAEMQKELG